MHTSPFPIISPSARHQISEDQRKEVYEIPNPRIHSQTPSVGCIIERKKLHHRDDDDYELRTSSFTLDDYVHGIFRRRLVPNHLFATQPVIGNGTAFLVGEDLVLSAGHCFFKENQLLQPLKNLRIVFRFDISRKSKGVSTQFPKRDVYGIKKVIAYEERGNAKKKLKKIIPLYGREKGAKADWALLQLDRKVKGRAPLQIEFEKLSEKGNESIYMLGHPSGLPLKYVGNAQILKKRIDGYYDVNLDAFGGNSGSPVFDAITSKVIAILIASPRDPQYDDFELCKDGLKSFYSNTSEVCQAITRLIAVKEYLQAVKSKAVDALVGKNLAKVQIKVADYFTMGSHGFFEDKIEALRFYQKAAKNGSSRGALEAAKIHKNKSNDHDDDHRKQAFKYFKIAADFGCKEGEYQTGKMLFKGYGVQSDGPWLEYMNRSARQGYQKAIDWLSPRSDSDSDADSDSSLSTRSDSDPDSDSSPGPRQGPGQGPKIPDARIEPCTGSVLLGTTGVVVACLGAPAVGIPMYFGALALEYTNQSLKSFGYHLAGIKPI